MFFNCIHPRYGYFVHWPFPGSLTEQPYRVMELLTLWRGIYREKLSKDAQGLD